MSRSEKAERTYQQILDVSSKLFREQGYEKTSIQDILNELRMSKGAVYHHFNSKKEILDALEQRKLDEQMRFVKNLLQEVQGENALEKLRTGFEQFLLAQEFHEKEKENLMAHLDPHMMISDIKMLPEHAQRIIGLIKEGIADGSIQTDYPTELAEILFLLLNVWINPILFPRSATEAKRRLKYLQLVIRSLGADFITDKFVEDAFIKYKQAGFYD